MARYPIKQKSVPKVEEEDEELEEEEEIEEEDDSELSEEDQEKFDKQVKSVKDPKAEEKNSITIEEVIYNLDNRMKNVESFIYRLKSL